MAELYSRLAAHLAAGERSPYDFVVVDEAQDVSVAQLRFVAALGAGRPEALFFAGDLGQRIFQVPFSWLSLGVDIRGRSATLRINYRTSHQIRAQADRLLGKQVSDVDGNMEEGVARSRCSTGRTRWFACLTPPRKSRPWWATGWRNAPRRGRRPERWASSSVRRSNCRGRARPWRRQGYARHCSMTT